MNLVLVYCYKRRYKIKCKRRNLATTQTIKSQIFYYLAVAIQTYTQFRKVPTTASFIFCQERYLLECVCSHVCCTYFLRMWIDINLFSSFSNPFSYSLNTLCICTYKNVVRIAYKHQLLPKHSAAIILSQRQKPKDKQSKKIIEPEKPGQESVRKNRENFTR